MQDKAKPMGMPAGQASGGLAGMALPVMLFLFFLSAYPQYRTVMVWTSALGLSFLIWQVRHLTSLRQIFLDHWPPLLFVLVAFVLSPFALNVAYAQISALKLGVEILGGIGLIALMAHQPGAIQHRLTFAASLGALIGLGLILGDALSLGQVFGWFKGVRPELVVMNSNSAPLGFAVVMLPALLVRLWLSQQRLLALALCILALVAIFVLWQWAAKLAVLAALGGLGLGLLWRRFWLLPLGAIGLALIVSFPAAMAIDTGSTDICKLWSKPSSVHRLMIWKEAAIKIAERPIMGWGLENPRFFPDAEERVKLDQCAPIVGRDDPFIQTGFQRMPIYPHNVFLEIWLNLGLIGVGAGFVIVLSVARSLQSARPSVQWAAGATLSAVLIYFGLGYSLWQGWWLSTLFAASAFIASIPDVDQRGV